MLRALSDQTAIGDVTTPLGARSGLDSHGMVGAYELGIGHWAFALPLEALLRMSENTS